MLKKKLLKKNIESMAETNSQIRNLALHLINERSECLTSEDIEALKNVETHMINMNYFFTKMTKNIT
jgi:hypothetical protein